MPSTAPGSKGGSSSKDTKKESDEAHPNHAMWELYSLIAFWAGLFYFTSVTAGIFNKLIIKDYSVNPSVLTLFHLVFAMGADYAFLLLQHTVGGCSVTSVARAIVGGSSGAASSTSSSSSALQGPGHQGTSGAGSTPAMLGGKPWVQTLLVFAPISAFIVLGKLATYFSYEHVSMSLTHTAKASEPIFNVVLSALVFGELRPVATYLSLLPTAGGVALASTTDISYNHIGFFSAALSAMLKVMQNIYTKRVMERQQFSFFQIHFWCALSSTLTLAPLLGIQLIGSATNPFANFPLFELLLCSALQYATSISSYMVLSLVNHLTFTITNSMKRLVIIISGIIYFNQPIRGANIGGVALAVLGVLCYNLSKMGGKAGGRAAVSSTGGRAGRRGRVVTADVERGAAGGALIGHVPGHPRLIRAGGPDEASEKAGAGGGGGRGMALDRMPLVGRSLVPGERTPDVGEEEGGSSEREAEAKGRRSAEAGARSVGAGAPQGEVLGFRRDEDIDGTDADRRRHDSKYLGDIPRTDSYG